MSEPGRVLPYGRQSVTADDIEAVADVLRSDWITQGPAVPAFEAELAARCAVPHAVAVSSATAALHLACLALDVGPGDVVWTTPNTFVASANCARYCGADVDFVDIDPHTWNLCATALAAKLDAARRSGARLPKVVIPVHYAGLPPDLEAIGELAAEYGFRVIEDAAHAVGATYAGEPVGSCRHSDITVFSFHPVKIITTGEGGMALTRDAGLAARMARLRTHGIVADGSRVTAHPLSPRRFEQVELGWNYRMTDIQAALGLSQARRLDAFVARRRELSDRYEDALAGLPFRLQRTAGPGVSARHLFVIRVPATARAGLLDHLCRRDIAPGVHYIPVHLHPYYQRLGFTRGDFPEAELHYDEAISLPMYPAMTDDDLAAVLDALGEWAVSARPAEPGDRS